MTAITRLDPHEPLPAGPARHVIVLHRFSEEEPSKTTITLILTGPHDETTRPMRPDGTPMDLAEAIEAAKQVAESEKLGRIYVVDRTQGVREQDILSHGGDHSVHMDALVDSDIEDGERGVDMRDRRP